jgi:hypothetical protein
MAIHAQWCVNEVTALANKAVLINEMSFIWGTPLCAMCHHNTWWSTSQVPLILETLQPGTGCDAGLLHNDVHEAILANSWIKRNPCWYRGTLASALCAIPLRGHILALPYSETLQLSTGCDGTATYNEVTALTNSGADKMKRLFIRGTLASAPCAILTTHWGHILALLYSSERR